MRSFNLIPLYPQFGHKVELGSRAGALRQMLLDLLEDPQEIRRICIMGRNCTVNKRSDDVECALSLDKQIADGKLYTSNCYFTTFVSLNFTVQLFL